MVAAPIPLDPELTLAALLGLDHFLNHVKHLGVILPIYFICLVLNARHILVHLNAAVEAVVLVALRAE
jgi:hypothetical protein